MSFVMFFLALFSSFKYEQSGDMRFSRFVFWGIGLVFFFGAYVIHSEEVKDQLRIILGIVSIIELLLIPSFGILIKESAVFALFSYAGTFFLSIILFYIDRSFWKTVLIRKKNSVYHCRRNPHLIGKHPIHKPQYCLFFVGFSRHV
ncbi:hypothetical protein [Butyrivibrio sp. AE3003]|uniref:hypothetical protein n=1 Tax=Butyrivibrio sp. AE3003 TaxID=1496721 RepID=UPI001A998A0E|nr:hypothetical protein [Butyrivibrio sp. AE3003]